MCWAKLTKEQICCKETTSPQKNGRSTRSRFRNMRSLWQSSSRPIHLRRQLSLPNIFHKEHGCLGPWVAQSSALCFPSNRSATAGTQASQGATAQAYSNSPPLEEPVVGVRVIPAARSSPVANPLETGPPLSTERHAMASTAWVIDPACEAFQPPRACPKHHGRS